MSGVTKYFNKLDFEEKLEELESFGGMCGLHFGIFLGIIVIIIIGICNKWQSLWFFLLIAYAVYSIYKSYVASKNADDLREKIKAL